MTAPERPVCVVVLLEVLDLRASRNFESQALRILERHGGRLLRAFAPDGRESSNSRIGEVHVLEFPDIAAFHAYRADSELASLAALRTQGIGATQIYVSGRSVDYDLSS